MNDIVIKTIRYKTCRRIFFVAGAACLALAFPACDSDSGPVKTVDLRYRVEDVYRLDATAPEPVAFVVKSSDPWRVYGKADWYTVSPDRGEAGEKYTVEIRCTDNRALDDRTDTLTIQSDYWIGKRFTVIQQGTAYLRLESDEPFTLGKNAGQGAFRVLSNQDWSVEITGGSEWLSVAAGATGSLDGEVTLAVTANTGEARSGQATVYDRHGEKAARLVCRQDGVTLNPASLLYKEAYDTETLRIPVESNADWTVTKENPDDEWFAFDRSEFSGSDELIVRLEPNKGSATRTTRLIFSTRQAEGVQPVVKTLVLKQAYLPKPVVREFEKADLGGRWSATGGTVAFDGDAHIAGGRIAQDGFAPGLYSFYLKEMSADAYTVIYFTYGDIEIRWHIDAASGLTDISTRPWTPTEGSNVAIDIAQPHVLSFHLTDAGGYMQVEWLLDGQSLHKTIANIPNNFTLSSGASSYTLVGCDKGSCVYDKYEYTEPVDWGDE